MPLLNLSFVSFPFLSILSSTLLQQYKNEYILIMVSLTYGGLARKRNGATKIFQDFLDGVSTPYVL